MKKFLILFILFNFFALPFAEARHSNLPEGGYIKSCSDCSVEDSTLRCMCLNKAGRARDTSLFLTYQCGSVENIDGNLRCSKGSSDSGRHPHEDESWDDDRDSGSGRPHGRRFEIESGPIWSQMDAGQKCPRACYANRGEWTGTWRSIRRGQGALCECKARHRRPRFDEDNEGLSIQLKL